jgi:MFS family permease
MSPLGDMLMKSMSLTTRQFGFAVSGLCFQCWYFGLLTAGFADRVSIRKKLLLVLLCRFLLPGTFVLAVSFHLFYADCSKNHHRTVWRCVFGSISLAIVADLFPLEQTRDGQWVLLSNGFGA